MLAKTIEGEKTEKGKPVLLLDNFCYVFSLLPTHPCVSLPERVHMCGGDIK